MKCIPIKDGHICLPDVPEAVVTGASGREYRFEFDRMLGPMVLRMDGEPFAKQPSEKHEFWDAFEQWHEAWKSGGGQA